MKIYCIGNALIKNDSLPLRLIPVLQKEFPQFEIIEADPNENFIPEDGSIIIDMAIGIDTITWLDSIDTLSSPSTVSLHDYDLGFHLQFLKKIGKLNKIRILAIPQSADDAVVGREIVTMLKKHSS